jgi:group I intron endonuclease
MKKTFIIGIYKITSPTGSIYIGQSTDINERWGGYIGLHCESQKRLYNSLKKHGVENHTFDIIHILDIGNLTKSEIIAELNKLEIYYIKEFNSFSDDNNEFGLNLTRGGDNKEWSKESRKKLSDSRKGMVFNEEHIENLRKSRLGKSPANKGIPMSEEQRLNMCGENNYMYGKNRSDESINKQKETTIKNKEYKMANGTYVKQVLSDETIKKREETRRKNREEKIANGTYVKYTHSEESLKKMRKPKSEEHKKNIGKSKKDKKLRPESIAKRQETRARIRQEKLTMIF